MSLPVGVYTNNEPNLTLTLFAFGWLFCGVFSLACFFLGNEERNAESHEWKIKLKASKSYNEKYDACDCRKCKDEPLTVGKVILGLITIPMMLFFLMVIGPMSLFPIMSDGHHKEAWAYIKRLDKRLNFFQYAALSLPVLALAMLWWM